MPRVNVVGVWDRLKKDRRYTDDSVDAVFVYTPFISDMPDGEGARASRADLDWEGDPLTVAGRSFTRGIGVHSYSRLVYELDGKRYKAFRTRYGINDKLSLADVTVRIKLDDRLVHEKRGVKAGELSPVVVVELGDAKRLVLEVDYGGRIDTQDRLNWLEPALLRDVPEPEPENEMPTTQPAATTQPSSAPTTVPTTMPS